MPGDRDTSLTERYAFGVTYAFSWLMENCFLDLGACQHQCQQSSFYREEKRWLIELFPFFPVFSKWEELGKALDIVEEL